MICLRTWTVVEALQFDGSLASSEAIAARFPRRVARSLVRDDGLMVVGRSGLVPADPTDWVVLDIASGCLDVWTASEFRALREQSRT